MRKNLSAIAVAVVLLAVTAAPAPLAAQQHHHYKLIDLGTFGGPASYFSALFDGAFFSSANVLNRSGTFAGWADTPDKDSFPAFCFNADCYVSHAMRWHNGSSTDLGALAEGWSSAATWINNTGEIVGISQNGIIDPAIGFPEERAVLWRDGQMIDLGTLRGNQSNAASINNHGQIAGLALNTTPDPFSIYDYLFYGSANGTQTRAVLWDENGNAQDLGTLGGPDAYAAFVNGRGQVTGWSYTNFTPNASSGGLPTFHPFLWERGKGMRDLGTLGGTIAQAVNGMNERGEVIGSTTMAGDTIHHPFLWDGKKLIDLGTFGGDNGEAAWVNEVGDVVGLAQKPAFCPDGNGGDAFLWSRGVLHDLGTSAGLQNGEADFINSKGQVVGYSFSCDLSSFDGFLWEHGSIVDLNTLISPNSGFFLGAAEFISDSGEIAAFGVEPNSDSHVVLLIPCDENHPGIENCDYSMVRDGATATVSTMPDMRLSPHAIRQFMKSFGLNSKLRYRGPNAAQK